MTRPWNDVVHIGRGLRRSFDMMTRRISENPDIKTDELVALSNSMGHVGRVIVDIIKSYDHEERIRRLEQIAQIVKDQSTDWTQKT